MQKKVLQKEENEEKKLLEKCHSHLFWSGLCESFLNSPLRNLKAKGFSFLTLKPELIVLNLDETQMTDERIPGYKEMVKLVSDRGLSLIKMYGRMEMEMADLSLEDQKEFMEELGIKEVGRERLIREAYKMLGLISFSPLGMMRFAPGRSLRAPLHWMRQVLFIPIWQEVSYEPR